MVLFVTTSDGGSNWPFATSAATRLPDCGGNNVGSACAAPAAVDPNNSAIVYVINGAQLFASSDTGATFTSVHTFPQGIQAVSIPQTDSNTMWVGLADGTV